MLCRRALESGPYWPQLGLLLLAAVVGSAAAGGLASGPATICPAATDTRVRHFGMGWICTHEWVGGGWEGR